MRYLYHLIFGLALAAIGWFAQPRQSDPIFAAEYFPNPSLSGNPTLVRSEVGINHNWCMSSPGVSIPKDNFSARWTATLSLSAGTYYFRTYTDDGVRLYVNNKLIINKWVDQEPAYYTAVLELEDGDHLVVMEYYEKGGRAAAHLEWARILPHNERGVRIMPLGDSITHGHNVPGGYRVKLYSLLHDVNFVGSQRNGPLNLTDKDHEAYPGLLIHQIADNVDGWLAIQQPDIILLQIGTNDMGRDDWSTAPDRISGLIDQITTQRPNTELLVANLIPTSNGTRSQRVEIFNGQLPTIIAAKRKQGKRVHFVDLNSTLTLTDLVDIVHPNVAGYDKMADKWAEVISLVQGGQTPPLPDSD